METILEEVKLPKKSKTYNGMQNSKARGLKRKAFDWEQGISKVAK